jgi:hypothetical protein
VTPGRKRGRRLIESLDEDLAALSARRARRTADEGDSRPAAGVAGGEGQRESADVLSGWKLQRGTFGRVKGKHAAERLCPRTPWRCRLASVGACL